MRRRTSLGEEGLVEESDGCEDGLKAKLVEGDCGCEVEVLFGRE